MNKASEWSRDTDYSHWAGRGRVGAWRGPEQISHIMTERIGSGGEDRSLSDTCVRHEGDPDLI